MKNIKRILFVICSILFIIVVSLPLFFTWKSINSKDFNDYNERTVWKSKLPYIELILDYDINPGDPSTITGFMCVDDMKIKIFISTLNRAKQIFVFSLDKNIDGGQICGDPIFEGTYEFEGDDFVIDVTKDHDNVLPEKLNRIYFTKLN